MYKKSLKEIKFNEFHLSHLQDNTAAFKLHAKESFGDFIEKVKKRET